MSDPLPSDAPAAPPGRQRERTDLSWNRALLSAAAGAVLALRAGLAPSLAGPVAAGLVGAGALILLGVLGSSIDLRRRYRCAARATTLPRTLASPRMVTGMVVLAVLAGAAGIASAVVELVAVP